MTNHMEEALNRELALNHRYCECGRERDDLNSRVCTSCLDIIVQSAYTPYDDYYGLRHEYDLPPTSSTRILFFFLDAIPAIIVCGIIALLLSL